MSDDADLLRAAADQEDIAEVQRLLAAGVRPSTTEDGQNSALIFAADRGNLAIARLLIGAGANVNYHTEIGESPLGCAITSKDFQLVKYLIAVGADPTSNDISGTPYEDLAKDSSPEILSLIVAGQKFRA